MKFRPIPKKMNLVNLYSDIYSNPGKWSGWRKDFHTDEELTEGAGTAIASGTLAVIDTASTGNYGIAQIANNGTDDNSGYNWYYDAYGIGLVPSRTTLFSCKIVTADVTQCDFKVGLNVGGDNDWIAAVVTHIGFRKDDGDAYLDIYGITNSVGVVDQAAVATLVNSTEYTLTIRAVMTSVAGTGTVYFYVNGTLVADVYSTTWPASATYALTGGFAYQSGEAAAKTFNVDFIEAWMSRETVG